MIKKYGGYRLIVIEGGGDGISSAFQYCYGKKENVENFMKIYFFIGIEFMNNGNT